MSTPPIYLDAAATTPLHPGVREAMLPLLTELHGNPSSLHPMGREVRRRIEQARVEVAALLSCRPIEIVFTSGGTEANALALQGAIAVRGAGSPGGAPRVVTSAVEHPSVLATCQALAARGAIELTVVGVDSEGRIDQGEALAAIDERTALVSLMAASNETGVLQPVAAIAARVREVGALMHSDAVQMAGKLPVDVNALGVDLLTLSAHKLHGPKGVGALFVRKGVEIAALVHGGGQEGGLRPGTENAAGIVGLGAAAELARRELLAAAPRIAELRDRLERAVTEQVPGARVHSAGAERLPTITSIELPVADGAAMLMALGMGGVMASMGSACSSGTINASPALLAMGVGERAARRTLRFSLSAVTTAGEVDRAALVIAETAARIGRLGQRGGKGRGGSHGI